MLFNLTNIKFRCQTADTRGLKQCYLFLPSQVNNIVPHALLPITQELTLSPNEQFSTVEFDKLKGAFSESGENDNKAGANHKPTVTLQISRSRLECDTLITRLSNRKFHVLIQDYQGTWRFVKNLKLTYQHTIERGTNGYTLTFEGNNAQKSTILGGQIPTSGIPNASVSDVVWLDKNGGKWRIYVTTRGELVTKPAVATNGLYYYEAQPLESDFI